MLFITFINRYPSFGTVISNRAPFPGRLFSVMVIPVIERISRERKQAKPAGSTSGYPVLNSGSDRGKVVNSRTPFFMRKKVLGFCKRKAYQKDVPGSP
jgi:hypothetical protein